MSNYREFEFEDFQDSFTPADGLPDGEFSIWPELTVELTFTFHPAEPDVGIFHEQPEVLRADYTFDGIAYADERKLAEAIYAAVGDEIEEDLEAVEKAIRDQVNEWEGELEGDE